MARLSEGAENSISMAFVVMCAEKIRRLLRFLLSLTLLGHTPAKNLVVSGWGSGTFGGLKRTIHCSLGNYPHELPTPCYLTAIGSSLRLTISGFPNDCVMSS